MTEPTNPPSPDAQSSHEPDEFDAADKLVLTSPEEARSGRDFLLWGGLILLAALTIFSKPMMQGAFIWDDDRYVEQDRNLRTSQGLADIWTKIGITHGGTIQYYPLTFTSFWIEYQLFGGGVWPPQAGSGFARELHVTNVVLHAIGAILLWFLLRQLGLPGSWVIAAIWAIHPVQTESVSWISERKNVLCGVFYFGSILAFMRAMGWRVRWPVEKPPDEPPGAGAIFASGFYWLSFVLFICAMLSKTIACTLPAVLLVLLWWKQGRITLKQILATVPFFVVGIGLSLLTASIETAAPTAGGVGAIGEEWKLTILQRILVAGRAVWFYAWKLIWPADLAFIYPRWHVDPHIAWQWAFPIAVVVVLAALLLLVKWIGRGPFAACAIFVGTLIPALGFVNFYPMKYSFVADHFQYLAAPALIALIVVLIAHATRWIAQKAPATPYVLAGVVLVILAILSVMQSGIYVGQVALWQDTVGKNPDSSMTHYNYGLSLAHAADDFDAAQQENEALATRKLAFAQFAKTIELKPDHDRAWAMMGASLLKRNEPAKSLPNFERALSINPGNIEAMLGRAIALRSLKRYDDALAAYQTALSYAEQHKQEVSRAQAAGIFQGIGQVMEDKKDYKSAASNYAKAADIGQSSQSAYDYGRMLETLGNKPGAAEAYDTAIRLSPTAVTPRIALGKLMIEVGNLAGARQMLADATTILRDRGVPMESNPEYPALHAAAESWNEAAKKAEASTRPTTEPAKAPGAPAAPASAPISTGTAPGAPTSAPGAGASAPGRPTGAQSASAPAPATSKGE
jgi:tetratricopeptide (TPR) repeat protein